MVSKHKVNGLNKPIPRRGDRPTTLIEVSREYCIVCSRGSPPEGTNEEGGGRTTENDEDG